MEPLSTFDDAAPLRPRVYRAIAWSSLGAVLGQAITFGAALLITRLVTPTDFGTMAIAVAVLGLASTAADTGLAAALTQRQSISRTDASSVFWVQLAVGVFVAASLIALSDPIAALFNHEQVAPILTILACLLPLQASSAVPRALLIRELKMKRTTQVDLVAAVCAATTGVTLAILDAGVWALVFNFVVYNGVAGLGGFLVAKWLPARRVSRLALADLFKFARSLYGYTLINFLVRNGDNLLVGKFLGPYQLGLYARAYALLLLPSRQVTGVIGGAVQVSLARIAHDKERSRRVYLEACQHIAFVTMPLMLFVVVLADDLVPVLMGDQWIPAVPAVRILAVVGIVEPLAVTCGWLYFAQGRTDLSLRIALIGGPIVLAAIYLGVLGGSAVSTTLAYMCVNLAMIPFLLATAGRLVGIRLRDYARATGPTFAATLVAGVIAFCVQQVVFQTDLSQPLRLVLSAAVGTSAFLGMAKALSLPEIALIGRAAGGGLRLLQVRRK